MFIAFSKKEWHIDALVCSHALAFPIYLVVGEDDATSGQNALLVSPASRPVAGFEYIATGIWHCRKEQASAIEVDTLVVAFEKLTECLGDRSSPLSQLPPRW